MYQSPVTIEHTLKKIERNRIVLPAIQREFVWRPEQICRLFDSLMQGYPFGTFSTGKSSKKTTRTISFTALFGNTTREIIRIARV